MAHAVPLPTSHLAAAAAAAAAAAVDANVLLLVMVADPMEFWLSYVPACVSNG